MSRWELRDSHGSKRLHSRFDREPASPKKSRRDGKPATEKRYSSGYHLDVVDTAERDQKQRRSLQDALTLEVPPETESKVQPDAIKEGLDRKVDSLPVGNKQSSNTIEVKQSRSYFQQDERRSDGRGGRSSSRRAAADHGGGSDLKEQSRDRPREKVDQRKPRVDDNSVWRRDGFSRLEAEAPPGKKRPAFREKKIEAVLETAPAASVPESSKLPTGTRRVERGDRYSSGLNERPLPAAADERNLKRADRSYQRGETQRSNYNYQARERAFSGGGTDRFNGRYGERGTHHRPAGGLQVEEKWKHDLYDEANRSPTPKNDEDQIAKVEALLAL